MGVKKKTDGNKPEDKKETTPRQEPTPTPPVEHPLTPVFGTHLNNLETDENHIPVFLKTVVEFLVANGLDKEGLFRIPGSQEDINFYREKFDSGQEIDLLKADPHDIAGLLKLFLRKLPTPLIPNLYDAQVPYIISNESGEKPEELILSDLRDVILNLPEPNLSILKYLIRFLLLITEKSDINKMTTDNIIRCIVPTVGCTPAIFSLPMKNYEFFFGNETN